MSGLGSCLGGISARKAFAITIARPIYDMYDIYTL